MMSGSFRDCDAAEPEGSADSSIAVSAGDAGGEGVATTAMAEDLNVQEPTLIDFDDLQNVGPYRVKMLVDDAGKCYSRDYLNALKQQYPKLYAKLLVAIQLGTYLGPNLREPYSKPLEQKILEFRAMDRSTWARLLYFFDAGKLIVTVSGFNKDQNQTPKKELELALRLRAEYFRGR